MQALVKQLAGFAGSFVEAVAVLLSLTDRSVSIVLAFLPDLLLRGQVNRIARIWVRPQIAQPY